MRKKQPTAVLVIAILHFIGGGLGAAGSLCGLAVQGAQAGGTFSGFGGQQPGQAELQQKMEKTLAERMPAYKAVQFGTLGVDLILSTMMIVSGIGLLQMASWGRKLSIVYALLSIVYHVFTTIYALAFSVPAMRAIFRELAAQDPKAQPIASIMEGAITVAAIIPALFTLYPIIVLIIMFRPPIVRAFARTPEYEMRPEEGDEEPDLPWGRLPPRGPSDEHFRPEEPK